MQVTHNQEAQLEPLIKATLRRYSLYTDFDELVRVGICGALIALAGIEDLPCAFSTFVSNQGRWAVQSYLRHGSSLAPYNRHTALKGEEQVKVQSLDALMTVPGFEPVAPNPYVEVENRVAAQQIWVALKERCTPRQLHVIKRTIVDGITYEEVAKEEGVSPSRIYQIINEGLAKYHRRYQEVEVHGSCRRASSHRNRSRRRRSASSNRTNGTFAHKVGKENKVPVGERSEAGRGCKAA